MASEDRPAAPAVAFWQSLQSQPYGNDFFQVLRRLENLHPQKPRIGRSQRPSEDPVRLGQDPSLAFAASTLASCTPGRDGRPPRLGGYFFGLFGPNGPLPIHLTEYAQDRLRSAHDPTFARFLDLFHHRMLSLFYRAWANNRPTVSFDREQDDHFAVYVASLFGLGMPSLRGRDALPDRAKLHYAGLLACQTRHPDGLQAMVRAYFGLPAAIREFVGEWLALPREGRCRLGASRTTGTLGESVVIGASIWSGRHKFRLMIGPVGLAEFRRFLPIGSSLPRLTAMVRSYVGDELAWELNPILAAEEVPPLRLGEHSQLGWTSWLTTGGLSRAGDDLIFNPPGAG